MDNYGSSCRENNLQERVQEEKDIYKQDIVLM